MLKENPKSDGQDDLFRLRLDNIIDMGHPLVKLAETIAWDALEKDFALHYCPDNGRPGGSIRLMAGLLFLKNKDGISNEELCRQWQKNPYFQYFCGEEYFQHTAPVKPQSISNFYIRIGEEGDERLTRGYLWLANRCPEDASCASKSGKPGRTEHDLFKQYQTLIPMLKKSRLSWIISIRTTRDRFMIPSITRQLAECGGN